MNINNEQSVLNAVEAMYQDSAIRDREYYPEFRAGWDKVFKRALASKTSYLPEDSKAIYTVKHSYGGFDLVLHFDQLKMADWYQKEIRRKSKTIFVPKRLKRSRRGVLSLDDSICRYDPDAMELALSEDMKNIIACGLPGLPPELCVVYGNKWVDSKFGIFRQHSMSLYFLNTDYVPAFLGSPMEVCLYLFLMDCCIIKANYQKVKDADLKQFIHIFRPSPMLKIKGLI